MHSAKERPPAADARREEERLAEALRKNLKRRRAAQHSAPSQPPS